MKITAKEYYRKGEMFPFVSWKIDSVTAFGDHRVEFDLLGHRVVRSSEGASEVIATIHAGYRGGKLSDFFGTVESEVFIVTKCQRDWLSGLVGNVIFEITLKDGESSLTRMVMRYDFSSTFRLEGILDLRLTRGDRAQNYRCNIEGTCLAKYQDLGEVMASLLLHHNEEQRLSS
ncbi:MAG: hypothetical protein V4640_03300 [Verrucomicrobiota bacterium]